MRLIDADALVIPEYKETGDLFVDGFHQGKIDALVEVTALAPTVDAVEVVRCKDCKRCERRINAHCGMVFVCNMFNSGDARRYRNLNDFCSSGERRTGDADA